MRTTDADLARMREETEKLHTETALLRAQTEKLNAQRMKRYAESHWHLLLGVLAACAVAMLVGTVIFVIVAKWMS